jgi:hypothetical protein
LTPDLSQCTAQLDLVLKDNEAGAAERMEAIKFLLVSLKEYANDGLLVVIEPRVVQEIENEEDES